MMHRSTLGFLLIAIGILLVIVGVLASMGALSWFGRLPGDIRVERPGFRLYAPIISMLLVSLALTLVTALVRRLWP